MSKIAIIGPGAIGGTVAAWLAQDPSHEITVCARTPFTELDVETPYGRIVARPRVVTASTELEPADWALIATKAYDSDATAPWLNRLLGPNTAVAVLQNGVEHVDRFAKLVPVDRIVPVVVELPAERASPGKIVQRRDAWMKVPDHELGKQYQALFAQTRIDVQTTNDWTTAAWTKLCLNCPGAVSAVTLIPTKVVNVPEIAELMRAMIRECITVGRAEGAQLPDSLAESIIENMKKTAPDGLNSMHADRLASRRMEIDARNGAIVRGGAKHGIPTPLNQAIVALLRAVEQNTAK